MKMKNKYFSQEQVLMDAFGFNLRDLHANREGRITKSQFKKAIQHDTRPIRQIILVSLVITLLSAIVLITDIAGNDSRGLTTIGDMAFMVLVYSGLVLIITTLMWLPFISLNRRQEVATTQGIVIVDIHASRAIVKIGNMRLRASRDAILTLKHMNPYVIHYLPGSKVIVSVEAMES